MEKKLYKPKSCKECPVFLVKECRCGVLPKEKTKVDILNLYNNCPIEWDK